MDQMHVAAEGIANADADTVWALVADANSYSGWGPWQDGGYRPAADGPSRPGAVQWFRYGRRSTTVERILETEAPRRLVYTVFAGLPVKNYRAEVRLTPAPSGGTAVSWTASWDKTLMGRLVHRRLQQVYDEVVGALVAAADQRGA